MSAPLRVLGARVLVQPDAISNAPTQRESGLYEAKSLAAAVVGDDPTVSVSRGTVIAVGTPQHPLKHEAESLARLLDCVAEDYREGCVADGAHMLRDLVRRQPCVSVGDDVLFSHDAGQAVTLDGTEYVILQESELLAVVQPEGVV